MSLLPTLLLSKRNERHVSIDVIGAEIKNYWIDDKAKLASKLVLNNYIHNCNISIGIISYNSANNRNKDKL